MTEKKKTQEPVTFMFKKMWRFAKGHRHLVVIFLIMSALANVVLLAEPLIFAELLNEIQQNGLSEDNIRRLIVLIAALLGMDILFWIFHGPSRVIENVSAFRTMRAYKEYLVKGVFGLGLSWHALRDSGDTIDKINKASHGLFRFSYNSYSVVQVLVKAIGTTVILLTFDVVIGIMAVVLIIVAFVLIYQFDVRLIPQYKRLNNYENKISAGIFDSLSNITTVKVLHIEKPVFEGIQKALWAPFNLFKRNKILVESKWFAGSMMFSFIVVAPLTFYVLNTYQKGLPLEVGTISAMFLYLSNLIDVYFAFAGRYDETIQHRTSIMNAEPVEESFKQSKEYKRRSISTWETLALKDVNFSYEGAEEGQQHIDGVNLALKRGESVALIGESGSGKTTFLKVFHGMYPSVDGHIAFDGGSFQVTSFSDIDLQTTLVPQEPEVFSASIRENITLGIEYSDEEIFNMADLAEFTKVIKGLPRGLDSVINEKGVNLSGGQKQRLALTRALLFSYGKRVLLLDESTSSVDPETEIKIYKNIFSHFEGKTAIASVHKMNLLKYFDRIVMFADGKVVDQGTFEELLQKNQKFKADWEEYSAHTRFSKESPSV